MAQFSAFAGGMTEELGQRLSEAAMHRAFSVVPCSLARARAVTEVGAIGKQLGADLALTGKLTARETDARVELALVDGNTGRRLRRTAFTGPLSDPMTLDFLMTEKSLDLLGYRLEPRERRELAAYGTADPVAYQRYLEGLGRLYYSRESGRQKAAIESFREALALDRSFAQARTEIGNAHLSAYEQSGSREELQEALSDCLASSGQKPELPGAQCCLGRAYLQMEDLVSAVGCFERARFLSASDLSILEDLAQAYEAAGRKEDAERIYAEAVRQKPDYWISHSLLGAFYFHQSRFQEAEAEFSKVVKLAPQYYRAHSNLCGVYGELFRWEDMQRACEQSLQMREEGAAYTNLATAYFFQHRFSAAVEVARKALIFLERNDPQSQSYIDYGNLAEVLYWSPGEREKAAGPYRKAIERAGRYLRSNARDTATLGQVALYHAMLGDKTEALEYLNRSLAIDPANPETLFKAGVIYKKFGDTERALKCLSEAVEKGLKPEKIALHPIFEDLNSDPKFRALVGRQ
jgi:serine/threonine-protein kinase